MVSKAGSKFLFCRASLSENRFALFRTHSKAMVTDRQLMQAVDFEAVAQAELRTLEGSHRVNLPVRS